jgi:hypothetical protein
MSRVEQWVEKFRGFGEQPSAGRYVALFDPEGTVFDSGMERPLKVPEMAPHVEWQAGGHCAGKPFRLNVVDCFEFIEGCVIYGTAYFDTVTLIGLVNPAINSIHFVPSANAAAQQ